MASKRETRHQLGCHCAPTTITSDLNLGTVLALLSRRQTEEEEEKGIHLDLIAKQAPVELSLAITLESGEWLESTTPTTIGHNYRQLSSCFVPHTSTHLNE